jgi:predicted membrane metal-binding protein
VLRADRWRQIGRRGGLGGIADRLRRRSRVDRARARRRARGIVEGVVLGDEQSLLDTAQRLPRLGLYHLLAVSGQNVVLVAAARSRWRGCSAPALARADRRARAIAAYVLAVGRSRR